MVPVECLVFLVVVGIVVAAVLAVFVGKVKYCVRSRAVGLESQIRAKIA